MVMMNNTAELQLVDNSFYPDIQGTKKTVVAAILYNKRFFVVALDMLLALLTVWMAFSLRLELLHTPTGSQWLIYLLAPLLMLPVFIYSGLYQAVYRHSGFTAFVTVVKAVAAYGLFFLSALMLLNIPGVPLSIGILQPMICLLMIGGSRGLIRFWYITIDAKKQNKGVQEKLLIYGAGSAGMAIVNSINRSSKFDVAGFVDDNPKLHGLTLNGLKVYSLKQAEQLIANRVITNVLLAMPSASRIRRNEIVEKLHKYPVHIQMLPGVEELIDGRVTVSDIKEIQIEDLLGRDPVSCNKVILNDIIAGKVVMVTGAGGSIGSELCQQLLTAYPSKLLLVDNTEYNLFNIHNELESRCLRLNVKTEVVPLLGDVTDKKRLAEICRAFEPSVIYHAAAYKHVPMVEHNPVQGVRNNVLGTLAVAEVAVQFGVSSVVLVSTDKAVRPTNVMGASKRLCELIFQALADNPKHKTCFSMVRFGNVLGSSGSVVSRFRQQIKEGGPVTITHKDITRYFMTIPEAAQLIIQAGAMASGGDVFLLDMGEPVKIIDLARRMIALSGLSVRDVAISVTGLRPGEKLYEELLIGNNPSPTSNPRIFKAKENFMPWSQLHKELAHSTIAINNNDSVKVKRLVMRLVPEYQPTATTADFIAIQQKRQLSAA